jgi:ligand-binding sensor domain-containing protein
MKRESYGLGQIKDLVKFDGKNWTIYNESNSGLPSNGVWAIATDGKGNIWIGNL